MKVLRAWWFLFIISFFFIDSNAQSHLDLGIIKNNWIVIQDIIIIGNKHTKTQIILRELDLKTGDTLFLKSYRYRILRNENKIYNTQLFNSSKINSFPGTDSSRAILEVRVEERWYIFPSIIFELSDRNFNEWWHDRGRDFRRVDYGLKFTHRNFRGRAERLSFVFQQGFQPQYKIEYNIPYLNKKQNTGINFFASHKTNKSIPFETKNNKLHFHSSETIVKKRVSTGVQLVNRIGFYASQALSAEFNSFSIADTILSLNPNYLEFGKKQMDYFSFSYHFELDLRNIRAYATKGTKLNIELAHYGLPGVGNINLTALTGTLTKYFDLGRGLYFATLLKAKATTPSNQPYLLLEKMGYDQEFVRGYDLYVIDMNHFGLNRNTLRKKLGEIQIDLGRSMPIKEFRKVPFSFYWNVYSDFGKTVSNISPYRNNTLRNDWLFGYGTGIDIVSYYDSVLRLEYSMNLFNEGHFFIHLQKDI